MGVCFLRAYALVGAGFEGKPKENHQFGCPKKKHTHIVLILNCNKVIDKHNMIERDSSGRGNSKRNRAACWQFPYWVILLDFVSHRKQTGRRLGELSPPELK